MKFSKISAIINSCGKLNRKRTFQDFILDSTSTFHSVITFENFHLPLYIQLYLHSHHGMELFLFLTGTNMFSAKENFMCRTIILYK